MTDRLIFPDNFPGVTPVGPPILAGRLYRCVHRLGGHAGYLYRVLGFALHHPSCQTHVVYRGIDGPDARRLFSATPMDFATKFELAAVEAEADGPQEPVLPSQEVQEGRVVDLTSKGAGY